MCHTKSLRPTEHDFRWLIAPIGVETFLQDFWDRAPLIVSRNLPGYYSGLFSLNSVDELVGLHSFQPGGIRYLPCERAVDPIPFSLSEDGFADSADVYKKYHQGASLFFHGIHKYRKPIAQLCRSLTRFFRMPSGATAVVSPPGIHSSPTHFDLTNNFLIQVEGSKRYRIYESFEALPIARQEKPHLVSPDLLGDPLYDIELRSGDVLFIPRGFVHEGFASDQGSVHVTAGLNCLTWADLLIETVEALSQRQLPLRRALSPVILDSGDPTASDQEEYKAMLRLVLDEGKTIAQVARDLDLNANSVATWVSQARAHNNGHVHGPGGRTLSVTFAPGRSCIHGKAGDWHLWIDVQARLVLAEDPDARHDLPARHILAEAL